MIILDENHPYFSLFKFIESYIETIKIDVRHEVSREIYQQFQEKWEAENPELTKKIAELKSKLSKKND